MLRKQLLLLVVASILVASNGCCWLRRVLCNDCCDPCDRGAFTYFSGCSCGERYCGDWCSHPPKCDPCDDCGNYVGCCDDTCDPCRPGLLQRMIPRLYACRGTMNGCCEDDCGCGGY